MNDKKQEGETPKTKKQMKIRLSDNVHPNTDGSPWGWIVIDGTKIRIATYSGHNEKKRCQEVVDIYNDAWEIKPTHHRGSGGYGLNEAEVAKLAYDSSLEYKAFGELEFSIRVAYVDGFINGYFSNQESKKGFSLEAINEAINFGFNKCKEYGDITKPERENFIQSLTSKEKE